MSTDKLLATNLDPAAQPARPKRRPKCECEKLGHFRSGVKGVLAHVVPKTSGSRQLGYVVRSKIERCDQCERFATDREARQYLRLAIKEATKNGITLMALEYYRDAACQLKVEGEMEVDTHARVSYGYDGGAYVESWLWVPNPPCKICGEPIEPGGSPYCIKCAD